MAEEEEKQDLLYFGSVPVRFGRVDGSAFRYQHNRSFELPEGGHASNEAAAFVCKKEDGRDLVLPDIPAFAPCLKLSEPLNEEDAVEAFFCRPLLKEEGGSIEGIQSGRRSALIKVENRWFRLKGCGDLYGGFPLRTMKTSDLPKELRERLEKDKDTVSTFVEIRGCMFAHTSSRELFMSAHIEELLRPLGIPVANTPFGWWEYSLPEEPFASVKRTCAIYECLGEKRLGDHVLVGLERLLPLLVAPEKVGPTLLALFPPSRLQEDVTGGVMETWMHVLMDGPDEELVDCVLLPIERADILEDTLEQFIVSAGVSTLFLETWKDASTQLVAHLNELNSSSTSAESMSLLAYLFWRVGREAGQIQRVLRDNDISWGTYVDSLGTHCNSHPNNLVLLPHVRAHLLISRSVLCSRFLLLSLLSLCFSHHTVSLGCVGEEQ
ncbi:RNase H domain-containing protein, variant 3 [Balamuthia mandrillaris]